MKLFNKIAVGAVCSMMAIGVGVGLATSKQEVVSAADSYTITFLTGSGDGTALATTNSVSSTLSAGSEYVSGNYTTATKAYYKGSNGLKLGASSNAGTVAFSLAEELTLESIVVNAKLYNSSKATTLNVNGLGAQSLAADFADYTYTPTGAVSTITLSTSKYAWVSSIKLNCANTTVNISIDQVHPEYDDGWYIEGDGSGVVTFTSDNDSIYADGYYTKWESTDGSLEFANLGRSEYSATNTQMSGAYVADGGANDDELDITATVYNSDDKEVATATQTFTFADAGNFTPVTHVTGVSLSQSELNANVGDSPVTLTATIAPADATNKDVTWTSSKESVATVADGVVTFVGAGTTTITVKTTDGGYTATCAVTVAIAEPAVETKTVAELLALASGSSSNQTKAYYVTGTAKNVQTSTYGNFDLVDGSDSITVYGSSQTATALTYNTETGKYVFTNPKDFDSTKVPAGSIVTMKVIVYLYSSTKEVSGVITKIEQGSTGSEEPAVLTKTVAELNALASGGSTGQTQAYNVTGTVANLESGTNGNFDLVDGADSIKVYGSTQTATALAWDGFAYTWSNPKDFNSSVVSEGKIVTMKVIAYVYGTTKEISGVITNVQAGAQVDVTGVSLDKTSAILNLTETLTLTATVAPSNASNKNVTWSSNNTGVATVANGVVTAIAAGSATITVTTEDGGKTATCAITVTNVATSSATVDLTTVNDVSGDPTSGLITWVKGDVTVTNAQNGGTSVINYYPGTSGKTYTQTRVYNKNIMTFSVPTGKVITKIEFTGDSGKLAGLSAAANWSTGCTPGTATTELAVSVNDQQTVTCNITATCQLYSIKVTYKAGSTATVDVTGVTLDKTAVTLGVGGNETLTATVAPSNASNKNVSWSSSDETVATVVGGVVTAVAAGTATITVTTEDGGKTATCTVTVSATGGKTTLILDDIGASAVTAAASDVNTVGVTGSDNNVYTLNYANAKKQTCTVDSKTKSGMLLTKSTGFFANSTAIPGNITSVKVYTNNGASGKANYYCSFSTTACTSAYIAEGATAINIAGNSTYEYTCGVTNAKYFCVTVDSAANGQIYKVEVNYTPAGSNTAAEDAKAWAQAFNSALVCDATGATAPSTSVWAEQATAFAALSADAKAIITGADVSSSELDSDVKAAVSKYDYIVNKYGVSSYSDFLSRASSAGVNANNRVNDSTMYFVMGVTTVLVLSTVGAYFLLKKKKEN